ncbi:MAG: type II toxin-antitoxin system HigB family toxin [Saprospiraceae bacterium]|nr:type II toxin-antitoxin system HigB family toxin [Saprospiraceae bacterium]MBL0110662.1 type II toxin-antitoxin system HigB family toxin [Saprospiraceae bacterium]
MRIISKGSLRTFWKKHPDSEYALLDWHEIAKNCKWTNPNDLKSWFGNASIIGNYRVVFNIKGNTYRLVTEIDYAFQIIFIIWIGTHKEYDKIDVTTIKYNG